MSISELGSLGEIIGAIAVLMTLIYLSTQIRTTNRLARIDGHRDLLKQLNSWYGEFEDSSRAALLAKGLRDFDVLTPEEKLHFEVIARQYFHICEQAFYMGRDKYVPAGSYDAFMGGAVTMTTHGGATWWKQAKESSAPEFGELIDRYRGQMDEIPRLEDTFPLFRFSAAIVDNEK